MIKRIVSIILVAVLAATGCIVAFADTDSTEYNYKEDKNLQVSAEILAAANEGNFTWGQYSPAYFYPLDKTVHPISDIPKVVDEETGEETDEDLYVDSTSCDPEYEIIRIAAFYCFKCPECGTVHGDYSLRDLYTKAGGVCSGVVSETTDENGNVVQTLCNAKLPDPTTLKIYRFIVLDETAANGTTHSQTMRYYDFTKYADDVYGSTASLYGDGTDLPETSITFTDDGDLPTRANKEYDIADFSTTAVKAETGDRLKAWLLVFLTKLQADLGPKLENYADSSWAAFKNNVRVTMAGIWQNFLIALVGG